MVHTSSSKISTWFAETRSSMWLPLLLLAPSVFSGLLIDDYFHQAILEDRLREFGVDVNPVAHLFSFLPNEPAFRAMVSDFGFVPWWAPDGVRAEFFRPVTALTHMLDYWLWPSIPVLHHVHSLLWTVGACFSVRLLYRTTGMPMSALGIAILFFVVDDAHAMPSMWLANRNILLAVTFGCLSMVNFVNWRQGKKSSHWMCLFLLISLLSAEGGVATLGYMVGWGLVFERGWRARLSALVPPIVIIVVWRILYNSLGYGEWGTGVYTDPMSDPIGFAGGLLQRLPILMLGQWLQVPTEVCTVLPSSVMWIVSGLGAVVLGLIARQMARLLREVPMARFWAVGMILSLIPVCATIPMNRLLYFSSIGGFAVLGLHLSHLLSPLRSFWFVLHGPVAVALCLLNAFTIDALKHSAELPFRAFPKGVTQAQSVIYLSGVALPASFGIIMRMVKSQSLPKRMTVLSHGTQDNLVERVDEYTLSITAKKGWLYLPVDRMFRSEREPFVHQFSGIDLFDSRVVTRTEDGRPKQVHFRFQFPLEDARYRWVCFELMSLFECTPPKVGEVRVLKGMLDW
ncbi:MAG: hypothetical protein ACPGQS_05090 [Bradymonadia bacterium]